MLRSPPSSGAISLIMVDRPHHVHNLASTVGQRGRQTRLARADTTVRCLVAAERERWTLGVQGRPRQRKREGESELAEALDDGGVGLPAALAHRLQAVAAAGAFELVEERGHEA